MLNCLLAYSRLKDSFDLSKVGRSLGEEADLLDVLLGLGAGYREHADSSCPRARVLR